MGGDMTQRTDAWISIRDLAREEDRRAWRRTQRRWRIAVALGAIGSVAALVAAVVVGIGNGVVW